MSATAMGYVLGLTFPDAVTKLLMVGLADHAHTDGRNTWGTTEHLASVAQCSEATIYRRRAWLLEHGYLRWGDQSVLSGNWRPDHRPVVYDMALSEETRREWEASYDPAANPRRMQREGGRAGGVRRTTLQPARSRIDNDLAGGTHTTLQREPNDLAEPSKALQEQNKNRGVESSSVGDSRGRPSPVETVDNSHPFGVAAPLGKRGESARDKARQTARMAAAARPPSRPLDRPANAMTADELASAAERAEAEQMGYASPAAPTHPPEERDDSAPTGTGD